ncbi:hypothetical protein NEAUS05_0916 [Nematocida ausubeli]|nr:hypothetical protein NEAUS05_0766 [Nematocida ausubeli]KAI5147622.1 hypothetical protein NEAUS05_0916 [Nematocida ausubeli]
MKEYDIFLNTEESTLLFQYPLSTEVPDVQKVSTKCDNKYVQISAKKGTEEMNYKGIGSDTINKYYVLSLQNGQIAGTQVKTIVQMRPFLPETEETMKLAEKKETKVFAMNESQDELENRMKNPNYIVDKVNKTPWVVHKLAEYKESVIKPEVHKPLYAETSSTCLNKLKETIYNARVVNISELHKIYPGRSISDINQAVSEMTIPFLGRHILKPEYFNDLSPLLIKILKRMEEEKGTFKLTKDEIINPSEEFIYLLNQVAYKDEHKYVLKGFNENIL